MAYYTELQEIFKKFDVMEVIPTPTQIRETFASLHKPVEKTKSIKRETVEDLYSVFDEFLNDCGRQNDWTDYTYEKFVAMKNHLMSFRDGLTFYLFDEKGLNDYVTYLRDVKEMSNSTIGKQLSFLKWFLRWSFKKGIHQNNAYDSYKPKLKSTQKKIIFLTWEELNNHSKAILDKYKDVAFEHDKVLPVITNQKMNDYLKELAEMSGIDEPIRQTYYKDNERID